MSDRRPDGAVLSVVGDSVGGAAAAWAADAGQERHPPRRTGSDRRPDGAVLSVVGDSVGGADVLTR